MAYDGESAASSGTPRPERRSDDKPQFMTVGDGTSAHASQLAALISNDYDSGYGSTYAGHDVTAPWDPSLTEDQFTPASTPGRMALDAHTSEVERRALSSHVYQLFYNQNRTVLGRAISQTVESLKKLQEMNAKWPAHYPTVRSEPPPDPSPSRTSPRPGLHHTNSTNYNVVRPARPGGPRRAETSLGEDRTAGESSSSAAAKQPAPEPRLVTPQLAEQFSVLKIELKMQGASQTELVHSLEKQSIAALLDGQINNSIRHLFSLRDRIDDISSKVLVTGDLNAGKSTFCNALLRRKVLPEDQQPCTAIFCEVLDVRENGGLEEVHAVPLGMTYERNDESTYHVYALKQLEQIVVDNERYSQCKIYIKDIRSVDQSLLNNGVVDIALIDAPGLNNDSIKTTAVFARQEEIDVVVFVVSAANHFTQSAKEFIFNAAREKAYMFMVVNGFDNIKDKRRCQEMILKQTAQLSPATFKESAELVHFVSSNAIPVAPADHGGVAGGSASGPSPDGGDDHGIEGPDDADEPSGKHGEPGSPGPKDKGKGKEQDKIDDFNELEASLRRFVLEKRARSKLAPAKTYLMNVLRDMNSLATVNRDVAQNELDRIGKELEELEPAFQKSRSAGSTASESVDTLIEDAATSIYKQTRGSLNACIAQVGIADLGVEYPGLLGVYNYAETIKTAMLQQIADTVTRCEEQARDKTVHGVNAIKSIGLVHLGNEYVDLTFLSEKMFRSRNDAVTRQIDVDVELWDFFDATSLWERQEKVAGTSMAVTVAGVLGTRFIGGGVGWFDGTLSVAKMVGSQNLRRVIVPSIVLATALGIAYILSSIPHSLPRRLSSKLATRLEQMDYTHANATRVSAEARRALRHPAKELNRSLQSNMEKLQTERQDRLRVRQESEVAKKYFGNLVRESGDIRSRVERVDLEGPAPGLVGAAAHL